MQSTPKVSFLFPYRWIVDEEDRKYLKQNLENLIKRNNLNQVLHPRLQTGSPGVYSVILNYHSYEPVPIPLTQEQMGKLLKDVFPGAHCAMFKKKFIQKEEDEGLPVMELELYF